MSLVFALNFEELRFTVLVCVFAHFMYVFHTMAVGNARQRFNIQPPRTDGPKEFVATLRVQQNDAEQIPGFYLWLWLFSVLVSAKAGGLLGVRLIVVLFFDMYFQLTTNRQFFWVVCRIGYGFAYMNGETVQKYTVPAYMIINIFAVGSLIVVAKSFL